MHHSTCCHRHRRSLLCKYGLSFLLLMIYLCQKTLVQATTFDMTIERRVRSWSTSTTGRSLATTTTTTTTSNTIDLLPLLVQGKNWLYQKAQSLMVYEQARQFLQSTTTSSSSSSSASNTSAATSATTNNSSSLNEQVCMVLETILGIPESSTTTAIASKASSSSTMIQDVCRCRGTSGIIVDCTLEEICLTDWTNPNNPKVICAILTMTFDYALDQQMLLANTTLLLRVPTTNTMVSTNNTPFHNDTITMAFQFALTGTTDTLQSCQLEYQHLPCVCQVPSSDTTCLQLDCSHYFVVQPNPVYHMSSTTCQTVNLDPSMTVPLQDSANTTTTTTTNASTSTTTGTTMSTNSSPTPPTSSTSIDYRPTAILTSATNNRTTTSTTTLSWSSNANLQMDSTSQGVSSVSSSSSSSSSSAMWTTSRLSSYQPTSHLLITMVLSTLLLGGWMIPEGCSMR